MSEQSTSPAADDAAAQPVAPHEPKKLGTELSFETFRTLLRLRHWGRMSLKEVLTKAIALYADSSDETRKWADRPLPDPLRRRHKLPAP